jgi:hypothetical protein
MMEAVLTSETSVDNHFTRQYIPEDNSEQETEFKFSIFWDMLPFSQVDVDRRFIALMMEAVRTSETSANTYLTTRQYIAKDSKLHSPRLENLKSHKLSLV